MRTCAIPRLQVFLHAAKESCIPEMIVLAGGKIRRIEVVRGVLGIDCIKGRVWITQEGDSRDLILKGGESDKTAGRGLVLIESLEPAVVRIIQTEYR